MKHFNLESYTLQADDYSYKYLSRLLAIIEDSILHCCCSGHAVISLNLFMNGTHIKFISMIAQLRSPHSMLL